METCSDSLKTKYPGFTILRHAEYTVENKTVLSCLFQGDSELKY